MGDATSNASVTTACSHHSVNAARLRANSGLQRCGCGVTFSTLCPCLVLKHQQQHSKLRMESPNNLLREHKKEHVTRRWPSNERTRDTAQADKSKHVCMRSVSALISKLLRDEVIERIDGPEEAGDVLHGPLPANLGDQGLCVLVGMEAVHWLNQLPDLATTCCPDVDGYQVKSSIQKVKACLCPRTPRISTCHV